MLSISLKFREKRSTEKKQRDVEVVFYFYISGQNNEHLFLIVYTIIIVLPDI